MMCALKLQPVTYTVKNLLSKKSEGISYVLICPGTCLKQLGSMLLSQLHSNAIYSAPINNTIIVPASKTSTYLLSLVCCDLSVLL